MIKKVVIGSMNERKIKVGTGQTTSFLWEGENVFSTPPMIAETEETCRLLLKEQFIPESENHSVGTIVNVKHLAATPHGAEILLSRKIVGQNEPRTTYGLVA